jgi:hypothetical protein
MKSEYSALFLTPLEVVAPVYIGWSKKEKLSSATEKKDDTSGVQLHNKIPSPVSSQFTSS